jgi:hypothetical protein
VESIHRQGRYVAPSRLPEGRLECTMDSEISHQLSANASIFGNGYPRSISAATGKLLGVLVAPKYSLDCVAID